MPVPVLLRRRAVSGFWLVVAALVCLPGVASAQIVRVPTFLVTNQGGSFRQSRIETVDVAVGRDGNVLFVWDDISQSTPQYTTSWSAQVFSPAGLPISPERINGAGSLGGTSLRAAAPTFPPPADDPFPFVGYAVAGYFSNTARPVPARVGLDGTIAPGSASPSIAVGPQNAWGPVVAIKATDDPVYASWSANEDAIAVYDPNAPSPLNRVVIGPVDPNPHRLDP